MSQETCRQSWSHASTSGGGVLVGSEHCLFGNAPSAFAVTCHVTASPFHVSVLSRCAQWRLGLLCSLSSLLLPAEGSAQTPPPTRLDPIEVAPSAVARPKPAARSRAVAAAAR
ncbi:hypothetical protein, partial [Bradyrhizobium brasilense]|uniref:hypothetical protein n=1 Tax=Bradyrhizobium brasilense TaxID=1419277 RepID=UPI001E57490A